MLFKMGEAVGGHQLSNKKSPREREGGLTDRWGVEFAGFVSGTRKKKV